MLIQASSRKKESQGEPDRANGSPNHLTALTCPSPPPWGLTVLLLFQMFSPIIPCALEAFSLSANPLLGCSPLPGAPSSHYPSLLLPSDLIRFLCIKVKIMYFSNYTRNCNYVINLHFLLLWPNVCILLVMLIYLCLCELSVTLVIDYILVPKYLSHVSVCELYSST